jgi:NAD(P)-dependent dehydrogenase (short-subunit alcohol dehydrogenase family)
VALVVGRGSGLARAIVLAALDAEARVVAAGRDQAGLASPAKPCTSTAASHSPERAVKRSPDKWSPGTV